MSILNLLQSEFV